MTVSTPAQLRAKATYRAKQLALRTAQAKRIEELEAALRAICRRYEQSEPADDDWSIGYEEGIGLAAEIAGQALEGSAKP